LLILLQLRIIIYYVNIEGKMGIIRSHIRKLSRITGEKVSPLGEKKRGIKSGKIIPPSLLSIG
jgi:hypothetical protein